VVADSNCQDWITGWLTTAHHGTVFLLRRNELVLSHPLKACSAGNAGEICGTNSLHRRVHLARVCKYQLQCPYTISNVSWKSNSKAEKHVSVRGAHHNVHVLLCVLHTISAKQFEYQLPLRLMSMSSIVVAESRFQSGLWRHADSHTGRICYHPAAAVHNVQSASLLPWRTSADFFLVTMQERFKVLRQSCFSSFSQLNGERTTFHLLLMLDAVLDVSACHKACRFQCRQTFEDKHRKCFKCVRQISKRLKDSIFVNDVNVGICHQNVVLLH